MADSTDNFSCMTTIVLAHPNQGCPRFQVFGVYDGPDDRFTFAAQEFDDRERAEWIAKRLMEALEADHFRRVTSTTDNPGIA